jgi:glycosyltransferase involved in cell wall biosynthesis
MDHKNKKIKVVIGSVYPYDESKIKGGVEAVALYLVSALSKHEELEIHVVSCTTDIEYDKVEKRGKVICHWISTKPNFYLLRLLFINQYKVKKEYDKIQPDIVHAQGFSEYALAKSKKIPLLLSIHGIEVYSPKGKKLKSFSGLVGNYRKIFSKYIAKLCIQKSNGIVSNGGDYIPSILNNIISTRKIYQIFNPISPDFFDHYKTSNSKRTLLWVGNITERKNILDLVKVMEIVVQNIPDSKLVLVGRISDHDYFNRMELEIRNRNLTKKIIIKGQVEQKDLIEIYQTSSIFLLTSIEETAPMVVAQALASGLPVVATKVGGIPWMIDHGETGFVAELGEINKFAEYVLTIINNEELMEKMKINAFITANNLFYPSSVAINTLNAYKELINIG